MNGTRAIIDLPCFLRNRIALKLRVFSLFHSVLSKDPALRAWGSPLLKKKYPPPLVALRVLACFFFLVNEFSTTAPEYPGSFRSVFSFASSHDISTDRNGRRLLPPYVRIVGTACPVDQSMYVHWKNSRRRLRCSRCICDTC